MVQISINAIFDEGHEQIDRALLNACSEKGQLYRKSLLKDRWIVLIATGPELSKVEQYLHYVDQLGIGMLFLVETKSNPLVNELERQRPQRVTHIPVDLTNRPSLLEDVVNAVEDTVWRYHYDNDQCIPNQIGNSQKGLISALYTLWDDAVSLAARVQKRLGFFGDSAEVVDRCHDKLLARLALNAGGIPGPRSVRLTSLDDATSLCKDLRFPIIVKPINGAASIGVRTVSSHDELINNFERYQAELQRNYAMDDLMGLTFDDAIGQDTSILYRSTFVAEEFIGGKEYDCDIIISRGEMVYGNINEDWAFKEGWMCERGMHHPASLPKPEYEELLRAAYRYAILLGCNQGVYHVEMKWDPEYGPQLIECNPRMGGAGCWNLHRNCWNVDLIEESVYAFMDLPSRPIRIEEPLGMGISHYLFCDQSGILREDLREYNEDFPRACAKQCFIVDSLGLNMRKGERVEGWTGDLYPTHLGRIELFIRREDFEVYCGPSDSATSDNLLTMGKSLRRLIKIPLENGDTVDEL